MFPRLLPLTLVTAGSSFSVAAWAVGRMPDRPELWKAAVALVVLGAITPLIYAVNVRIVPVFSRRTWRTPRLLAAALVLAPVGAWLTFAGRAGAYRALAAVGSGLALVAGLLFIASLFLLFRAPTSNSPAPPQPYPEHAAIDRVATHFTRLSGVYLLVGLSLGFVLALWTPSHGRWELVWAHAMLLGWFLYMASGVSYHVLARWTGCRWRHPRLIALHLRLTLVALPLMLTALALDSRRLLAVGGSLQAVALLLFVWNVLPMLKPLPAPTRWGITCAVIFLAIGVLIGASFAMDPVNHTRLRYSHAVINLFGFAGLLVSGVGYYLFPRFAGQVLPWPRLALAQVALQAAGVAALAFGLWWQVRSGAHAEAVLQVAAMMVWLGLLTFAVQIGATFYLKRQAGTVARMQPLPPLRRPR